MVDTFNALQQQYCGRAAFAGIYIEEAHSFDEWPLGPYLSPPSLLQPKMSHESMNERHTFGTRTVVPETESVISRPSSGKTSVLDMVMPMYTRNKKFLRHAARRRLAMHSSSTQSSRAVAHQK